MKYDWLLRIYPRPFRRRFGEDMRVTFSLASADARRAGRMHVLRLWIATVFEVVRFAAVEWRAVLRPRLPGRGASPGGHIPRTPSTLRRMSEATMTVMHDLRIAARSLGRRPSFTIAAVATLALGIGANTAVFSMVHGIMWRPLAYEHPDELVRVWPNSSMSLRGVRFLREHTTTLANIATVAGWAASLTGVETPTQLNIARTSANLFSLLGTPAAIGRTFRPDESDVGADPAVLLSNTLWRTHFGADSSLVGRLIMIDGAQHAVVGVMPESFEILDPNHQAWIPIIEDPDAWWYNSNVGNRLVARLAPGATVTAASQEFIGLIDAMRIEFDFADDYGSGAGVVGLKEDLVGRYRTTFFVLLGAVSFILLIAGSNLGSLLLAKATDRRREMALRAALGATRRRLAQVALTESVLLAVAGGLVGLVLAFGGVALLRNLVPPDTPRLDGVAVDGPVLLACAGFALGTALLFSLAPALGMTRLSLQRDVGGLRSSSQGGVASRRLRGGFVVFQVALAVMLVVGAGLMVQTLRRLTAVDPGFVFDRTLTLRMAPAGARYDTREEYRQFYVDLLARLEARPDVEAAGAIQHLPLSGWSWGTGAELEGQPTPPGARPHQVDYRIVTEGYFRSMGIPLLEGRSFLPADDAEALPVGIVNRTMARRLWDGASPLGKRLRQGQATETWVTIVGVVDDTRHYGLDTEPVPELYRPHRQSNMHQMMLAVRLTGDPALKARDIQAEVWAMEPDMPISDVMPLGDLVANSVGSPRMIMVLLSTFAIVALSLGAVGVYGVTAYSVSRRTNEIGVRMALGATNSSVLNSVLRQGMSQSVLGIAVGLVGAVLLTRFLSSFLFGISSTDPATFAGVALFISVISLSAIYLPARRASRVDPVQALRSE